MQIESIIQRKDGTHVTLGTTDYHFKPLADGAHVATVENDEHAQRFLSITEGFKIYRPQAAPVKAVEPEAQEAVTEDQDREALVEAYKAKFGKKPHPNTSIEKLQTLLSQE